VPRSDACLAVGRAHAAAAAAARVWRAASCESERGCGRGCGWREPALCRAHSRGAEGAVAVEALPRRRLLRALRSQRRLKGPHGRLRRSERGGIRSYNRTARRRLGAAARD